MSLAAGSLTKFLTKDHESVPNLPRNQGLHNFRPNDKRRTFVVQVFQKQDTAVKYQN